MAELSNLIKRRGIIKASLTRFINFVNNLGEEFDTTDLQYRLD